MGELQVNGRRQYARWQSWLMARKRVIMMKSSRGKKTKTWCRTAKLRSPSPKDKIKLCSMTETTSACLSRWEAIKVLLHIDTPLGHFSIGPTVAKTVNEPV